MQAIQKTAHDRVIAPLLGRTKPIKRPFLPLRLLNRFPLLRRIPSRIVGLGFGRELGLWAREDHFTGGMIFK